MQPIGFLDIVFIASVLGVNSLAFWIFFKQKKSKKCFFQKQLDEDFQKYIDSLREGGSLKDYKRAKKALRFKG